MNCPRCGKNMVRVGDSGTKKLYVCSTYECLGYDTQTYIEDLAERMYLVVGELVETIECMDLEDNIRDHYEEAKDLLSEYSAYVQKE